MLSVVLQPGRSPLPVTAASAASAHVPRATGESRLPVRDEAPQALQSPSNSPRADTRDSTAEIALRSDGQPAGPAVAARDAAPPAANAAGGWEPDADGVRQYRVALAVEARRFKRYPQSALADEIGGTVEVRIAVAAGGQTQEVVLARSSGYGALDEAALEMMREAAPRTAVPELLRRRPFVVNLPVVFDVANE